MGKLQSMPFLTDKSNPIGYCVQGGIEFAADSRRLIQRCTKPDAKEFKKIAVACAIVLRSWASSATRSSLSSSQSTTSSSGALEGLGVERLRTCAVSVTGLPPK